MEENYLCWLWSKDKVPLPTDNQVKNVIPGPAVQSAVTFAAAQLVTCSSRDAVRTWCGGAANPFHVTHPAVNTSQVSHHVLTSKSVP